MNDKFKEGDRIRISKNANSEWAGDYNVTGTMGNMFVVEHKVYGVGAFQNHMGQLIDKTIDWEKELKNV